MNQLVKATAVMLCAALALGAVACGDEKAPAPAPTPKLEPIARANPPAPVPAPVDQDMELSAVEQNELRTQLAAQATQEITVDNADRIAAALESEIEADLVAAE